MKSIVSDKGQVTIPKQLRERLGIRPGQILDFKEEDGRLVASKDVPEDPLETVYGILNLRERTDTIIKKLRGEVDTV